MQANALAINSSMGNNNIMWGYPASNKTYPQSYPGCYLNDVVTSNFPFTDIFANQTSAATHFDVLDHTRWALQYEGNPA